MASLGSLWLLVLAMPALGGMAGAVVAARFVTSGVQMALNHQLGRRRPITRPARADWLLLALALAGASVAAAMEPGGGIPADPRLIALALAPFSLVQLRIAVRSYRAAPGAAAGFGEVRAAGAVQA